MIETEIIEDLLPM